MLSDLEWFELLRKSMTNPRVAYGEKFLPAFPPEQLQRNTTGKAGAEAVQEAFSFYLQCLTHFAAMGRKPAAGHSLLDFGVGWGRIARCFIRDLSQEEIFGTDVTPDFIEVCRQTFRSNNFIVNEPLPPTPIPAARFDFIVAYSVFSHLSEAACQAWMAEFHRILKPGGMVAVTTRGRDFFATCEALQGQDLTGYSLALAELFEDFDEARRRYDAGEFVHANSAGVSGGGRMNASFYGETFIPEAYARAAFLPHFRLAFFQYDTKSLEQAVLFFSREG